LVSSNYNFKVWLYSYHHPFSQIEPYSGGVGVSNTAEVNLKSSIAG